MMYADAVENIYDVISENPECDFSEIRSDVSNLVNGGMSPIDIANAIVDYAREQIQFEQARMKINNSSNMYQNAVAVANNSADMDQIYFDQARMKINTSSNMYKHAVIIAKAKEIAATIKSEWAA